MIQGLRPVIPDRDHPQGGPKGATTCALLYPDNFGPFVLVQPLVDFLFEIVLILTLPALRITLAEYLDTHTIISIDKNFVSRQIVRTDDLDA